MTLAEAQAAIWPDPIEPRDLGTYPNKRRVYDTPAGVFPSVTNVCKVIGTGTEALMGWAGKVEREAVIEAACQVFEAVQVTADATPGAIESAIRGNVERFRSEVERATKDVKAAQKRLEKAGDIGREVHEYVHWRLKGILGLERDAKPILSSEAQTAVISWEEWWSESGLVPLRMEQFIWSRLGYAGTLDLAAWDGSGKYGGGLGVWDMKSSSYIYETHHIQVAAYVQAVEEQTGLKVQHAGLCRLPKKQGETHEVRLLGDLYCSETKGRKILTREELAEDFRCALTLYNSLVVPK